MQIAAHARWVNALEVHPSRDVMATAAEDCTVSVWKLPSGDGSTQLKHAGALVVQDAMLCGVGFCGGGGRGPHGRRSGLAVLVGPRLATIRS